MAKIKESIEVIQAKGKKHLTKEEIKNRKASEIIAPSDKLVPSIRFPEQLLDRLNYYIDELNKIGVISNLDIGALERYCILENDFYIISEDVAKTPKANFKYKEKKKDLLDTNKAMITLENNLGLNMISRIKLVAPKKEEKPINKFGKYAK